MKGVDGHREASLQQRARGIVQRMGRKANNNNNYESMEKRKDGEGTYASS